MQREIVNLGHISPRTWCCCCMLIGSVGAIILTVVFAINDSATVHTILPMILLIGGGILSLAKGR